MTPPSIPPHIVTFVDGRGDGTAVEYSDGFGTFLVWTPQLAIEPRQDDDQRLAGALYNLTEGNWSCDCNRRLDIQRAGYDVDDPGLEDECGDTTYTVLWAVEVIDGAAHLLLEPGKDRMDDGP